MVVSGSYKVLLNDQPIYALFCCTFFYLLFSVKETIEKYLMEKKYYRPFFLLMIEGIFNSIISLILIKIFSTIKCQGLYLNLKLCNSKYYEFVSSFTLFKDFGTENVWWMYLFIIIPGGGLSSMTKLTNYHFSPIHRTVSDMLSTFLCLLFFETQTDLGVSNILLQLFGNVIIFFGLLTYNEFLIINIFGLAKRRGKYSKEQIKSLMIC